MLDISSANTEAARSETPWIIDFIEIIIDDNPGGILRISSHFSNLITKGTYSPGEDVEYAGAAHLLGISTMADNLEVKDNSVNLSLSGIDGEVTSTILNNPIEGAVVYLTRGYFDQDSGELVDVPYERWAGRINSFSIRDDYNFSSNDKIVITVDCKSLLKTLLSRVNGRYTNDSSWKETNPGDTSMEFVASLVSFAPFFGEGAVVPQPPAPPPPPPSGGGGGKIVCTAMNDNYGFGSFRNAIWLNYAKENLTPYHEKGYHVIFRPWVDAMYKDTWYSPFLTKWGEGIARRRSADIFAVMKGRKKRSWLARIERAIMEPTCYLVGRWFSK